MVVIWASSDVALTSQSSWGPDITKSEPHLTKAWLSLYRLTYWWRTHEILTIVMEPCQEILLINLKLNNMFKGCNTVHSIENEMNLAFLYLNFSYWIHFLCKLYVFDKRLYWSKRFSVVWKVPRVLAFFLVLLTHTWLKFWKESHSWTS